MQIEMVMGAAAAGVVAGWGTRRVVGVARVRRSVAEYREHWRELAESHVDGGGALRYVALGDSAAQGVGASSPARGYVPIVADGVAEATGLEVALYNLSVSGAKATDLLEDQLPRLDGRGTGGTAVGQLRGGPPGIPGPALRGAFGRDGSRGATDHR